MPKAWIGTSGWAYKDWGKEFYPDNLPDSERLTFLAKEFPTVEINSSFYRLPAETTFGKWFNDTPEDFQFAVKVSRMITHIKRMKEVDDNWRELRRRAEKLGHKLGPFLFQFQSNFTGKPENLERIDHLLGCIRQLNKGDRVAFEFRHPTCFEPPMLELLQKHRASLVMADSSRFPHSPTNFAPAEFVYLRLHGPVELYGSPYADDELEAWAAIAAYHFGEGREVYAYFDNDQHGFALTDARKLRLQFRKLV
jgi:uncharacterized protein YecE (DUF72 family)